MNQTQEIKSLRERIAALQGEHRDLSEQARSREEVRQYIEASLARAEQVAAKDSRRLLQEIAFYGHGFPLHADVSEGAGNVPAMADLAPLLVSMVGADRVAKVLLADLDTIPEGLPKAQRAARLAQITAELDELEAREEALICEAEDAGEEVLRRPDARPEIVLALHGAPVREYDPPRITKPAQVSIGYGPGSTRY